MRYAHGKQYQTAQADAYCIEMFEYTTSLIGPSCLHRPSKNQLGSEHEQAHFELQLLSKILHWGSLVAGCFHPKTQHLHCVFSVVQSELY